MMSWFNLFEFTTIDKRFYEMLWSHCIKTHKMSFLLSKIKVIDHFQKQAIDSLENYPIIMVNKTFQTAADDAFTYE